MCQLNKIENHIHSYDCDDSEDSNKTGKPLKVHSECWTYFT